MTTSRSPQLRPGRSLPLIAATTAALPAVVLSSLAIAQPAAAESRVRSVPATLAAAMRAQAKADAATSLKAAVIPAASVPVTLPSALRPAQPAAPAVYTIARGDTISAIAGRYGLDTFAVLKLNNLQANTIIYPGQKIKLTGSTPAPAAPKPSAPAKSSRDSAPASGGGRVYVVKSGDTLSAIAARHGVGLSEIFKWNGLGMSSVIYPGQKVKVGGGSSTPAPSAPRRTQAVGARAGQLRLLHHQGRRHPLRHRGPQRCQALGPPVGQPADDVEHHLPGPEARHPRRVDACATGVEHRPATTTPLVPSTFLALSYPAVVVSSANQNKALLNASPQPSQSADEVDRGGHGPAHGRGSPASHWPLPSRNPASTSGRVTGQRDRHHAGHPVLRRMGLRSGGPQAEPAGSRTTTPRQASRSSASWSAPARDLDIAIAGLLPGPVLGEPERHVRGHQGLRRRHQGQPALIS